MDRFVFHNGMPMPEEVAKQLRERLEYQRLSGEAQTERQLTWIDEASADDLLLVRDFIRACSGDANYTGYLIGMLTQTLRIKFKICAYCGQIHETVEDLLNEHPISAPPNEGDDSDGLT